jgi:hypothetical protein
MNVILTRLLAREGGLFRLGGRCQSSATHAPHLATPCCGTLSLLYCHLLFTPLHCPFSLLVPQKLVDRAQAAAKYQQELKRLELARDLVWGRRDQEWRVREVGGLPASIVLLLMCCCSRCLTVASKNVSHSFAHTVFLSPALVHSPCIVRCIRSLSSAACTLTQVTAALLSLRPSPYAA